MILVFDTDSLECSVQCAVDVMAAHGVEGVCTNAPFMVFKGASITDLAQVVRCRDCKYFMEHNDGQGGNCNHLDYDGEYEFSVAGDWFCADGERREAKA